MKSICLCFQVHQPYRIRWYWPREGYKSNLSLELYFDQNTNYARFENASRVYAKLNKHILSTIKEYDSKYTFNISGIFLDQSVWNFDAIESFKTLADTGNIEFTCSPYYNSVSSLFKDLQEFEYQVKKHKSALETLFNCTPSIFVNAELIYNSRIGTAIKNMGFKGIIAEGHYNLLQGQDPLSIYNSTINKNFPVLLRHFHLSEDIESRFSDKNWVEYPLTLDKFISWINKMDGDVLTLYFDYMCLERHKENGILDFLRKLPKKLKEKNIEMINPWEAIKYFGQNSKKLKSLDTETVARPDINTILGNHMQNLYFYELRNLEKRVKNTDNEIIKKIYRYFQQVDVLESMHSVEIAVNIFSILSDFKTRIL